MLPLEWNIRWSFRKTWSCLQILQVESLRQRESELTQGNSALEATFGSGCGSNHGGLSQDLTRNCAFWSARLGRNIYQKKEVPPIVYLIQNMCFSISSGTDSKIYVCLNMGYPQIWWLESPFPYFRWTLDGNFGGIPHFQTNPTGKMVMSWYELNV